MSGEQIKPGYKRTEVGVIPEDWEVFTLQQLCREQICYGIVQCGPHQPNGVPYIRVSDMDTRDLQVDGMLRTTKEISSRFKRSCVETGDLVFALRGKLGEVRRVPENVNGANLTQGTARLAPFSRINSEYFLWSLQDQGFLNRLDLSAKGSTFREITLDDLRRQQICLPAIEEQHVIATALSGVDALLAKLDQLIAKKRDLKQATMQQLLTGQTRLPGFSGEWEVKRLGDVASLYQPTTISASVFTKDGYPVYGANGIVGYYHDFNHEESQVTVTCRGSTCGTVNKTAGKSWITSNAMVVNCDDSNSIQKEFLYQFLMNQNLTVCITGSGQPQIVRGPLANFEIRIPVDRKEQTAIATIFSDMDAELATLESRRDKTRALKQGMMQELLTGRIRLVTSGD